ncbi:MAG TPA: LPS assembly protein LptD [Stellaceae bacterium]|nr:LPS assembly protein LptD [Stellaceae bacterium]
MTGRTGRLALAALLGLWGGGVAQADLLKSGGAKSMKSQPMAFQADEVQYDEQLSLTVAKGHVEISQGPEVLLADVVTYNQRTDTVTASGHVSLMTPTGEVVFADYMELRDSMNNAFASDVRMLLSDRSRLVANGARRTNGNRLDMRKAVYSPCDLCKDDPTKPPAWQFKARQVTDDKEMKRLEFRDATLEIDGWPVFYTPYLSTADPTVKRASGFLIPSLGSSNNNGFHVSLPYYLVLGPDADLTFTPRFTTRAGTLLATEYRQRFSNGEVSGVGSINRSNVGFGSESNSNLPDKWRGHIDAHGVWDLDDTWRTGIDIQRVSDQTYLQRFGFPTPVLNSMISRAYLEGFHPNGSTDVNAYLFQPLLPGLGNTTQPIVLPVINRNWELDPDKLGGTLKFNANLLNIVRESGTQTRRVSLGSEWDKPFRDGIGGEYKFIARLRGDAYSVNNLSNDSNPDLPSAYFSQNGLPPAERVPSNFLAGRVFPQIGLTWDYPIVHRGEDYTFLVQPAAATFIGPSGGNRHLIPNEDSLGFQFRDTDLFRPDRMQGYDLLDTGQRVDYGLKFGAYEKNGGSYRALIGQSYRAEPNPFIPPGSGADKRLSDVVGRVVLSPASYLDLIYRFRLDKSSLSYRSQEIGVSAGPANFRVGGTLLLMPAEQASQTITVPGTGQTILYGKREQLTLNASAKVTRYWTVAGSETLNLTNSSNIVNGIVTPQSNSTSLYATISAIYQDECMAFITSVTQSGIRNGDVTPGYSVMFSVVFKNLGEIGGNILSVGGASGT